MENIYAQDLMTRVEMFATTEPTHTLFEDGRAVTSKIYEIDKKAFAIDKELIKRCFRDNK